MLDPSQIFLLSPANLSGRRGAMLLDPSAQFPLARELRSSQGAELGELFSFVSSLYFRGKLAYARAFGRAPLGEKSAYVISAIDYALVGSEQDFTQALVDAELPIDGELTPVQAQQARGLIGQVMLSALQPFLAQTAANADGLTLLVSQEIVSPSLKEYLALDGDLVGLGFPPTALASAAGVEVEAGLDPFLSAAQFDRGIALVSESELRSLEHGRENVVAHELGHALGLSHRIDAGNLMFPQVELDCRPCLDASQAATIATHW